MSPLTQRGIRAVVLDIEGTTTPNSFVHDVLFPYARQHLHAFVHDQTRVGLLDELAARFADERRVEPESSGAPLWRDESREQLLDSVAAYALWLMERDRKSPALKELQGHIWEAGYRSGQLRGIVFPDVPVALRRWRASGLTVAIYSSGSVLAQRLIFSTTAEGDLTPFIERYFDTGVGPKRSPESYARIASELSLEPSTILFVSDVPEELDAALATGFTVALAVRPGNAAVSSSVYERVESFDTL